MTGKWRQGQMASFMATMLGRAACCAQGPAHTPYPHTTQLGPCSEDWVPPSPATLPGLRSSLHVASNGNVS